MSSKGYSLPVNTAGILVLAVIFLALIFAIVSGGVQKEVDKLLNISEENTPDSFVDESSFSMEEEESAESISNFETEGTRNLISAG